MIGKSKVSVEHLLLWVWRAQTKGLWSTDTLGLARVTRVTRHSGLDVLYFDQVENTPFYIHTHETLTVQDLGRLYRVGCAHAGRSSPVGILPEMHGKNLSPGFLAWQHCEKSGALLEPSIMQNGVRVYESSCWPSFL